MIKVLPMSPYICYPCPPAKQVTVPVFAAAAVSRICRLKNLQAPRSHSGTGSECQSLMFPRQLQGGLSLGDRTRFCGSRGLKNLQDQEFAGAAAPPRDRHLRSHSLIFPAPTARGTVTR